MAPDRAIKDLVPESGADTLHDNGPAEGPKVRDSSPIVPPVKRQPVTALALATPINSVADADRAAAATVKAPQIENSGTARSKRRLKTLRAKKLKGRPSKVLKAEGAPRVVLASLGGFAELKTLQPPRRPVRVRQRGRDRPATHAALSKETADSERTTRSGSRSRKLDAGTKVAALSPSPSPTEDRPIESVVKGARYTVVPTWSAEDIAEAKRVCSNVLTARSVVAKAAPAVREGSCGAPAPLTVQKIGQPAVEIRPSAMLTCPMAAALDRWITEVVQPAALETFGVPVVRLASMSSYSCRNRYGRAEGRLSEHALINAVDLAGFVLRDGRTVKVLTGWGRVARDKPVPSEDEAQKIKVAELKPGSGKASDQPSMLGAGSLAKSGAKGGAKAGKAEAKGAAGNKKKTAESSADGPVKKASLEAGKGAKSGKAEGKPAETTAPAVETGPSDEEKRSAFLRKVHADACMIFGTVLGPEANDAHRNHFHLDMKARRGKRGYCQ